MWKKFTFFMTMLILFSVTISLVITNYGNLPNKIPTHFDASGRPDSRRSKKMILVFPSAQILFLILSLVFYRHPDFVNIPGTIALKDLPTHLKERMYELIRNTIFITTSILSLLMLYLTEETLKVAKGQAMSINDWGVLAILICLALPMAYNAIKMRRLR
ncbi:hypothetical protein AKJ45_03080 [candidate division MSBL1 archaeon SCGC-AAA261F19]|uniref:DUF1648 domain-containing protein n=1 Tax=candidate division MSBL1 archaeon SCGC-AAA261F19 TaxID=1698275 RepID=A0A133V921_9EURY|nr:hypothetical protein AKJ45_03080 [candidate division MSBL1 archaeon SCGC-AAA261F19]